MSQNIARRRGRKALRRKEIVAAKRRLEAGAGGLAERVRLAANGPVRGCFVPTDLFLHGIGTVILARATGFGEVAVAAFLVDTFCLGIKEAFFRRLDEDEFEAMMDGADAASPLSSCEPAFARKLLREAAAYARSIGFPPHPDFAAIERLFGEVDADASDTTFEFGLEGRPLYVPGPTETGAQIRRRFSTLRARLGIDGFAFSHPLLEDLAIDMAGTPDQDDGEPAPSFTLLPAEEARQTGA